MRDKVARAAREGNTHAVPQAPWRYGLPMVAVAVAFALVRVLHPVLDAAAYMVFLAAVMVCAVFAGLRAALVATGLAVLAIDFFFLVPIHSLALLARTDALVLLVFGGVGLLTSALAEYLRRGRQRSEEDARRAAGLAEHFQREADELTRDVDAMDALLKGRRGR